VWSGVEEEGINIHEIIKQKKSDLCKAPPQCTVMTKLVGTRDLRTL
jgi:hypothetical protein